jgi:hypothetical protein
LMRNATLPAVALKRRRAQRLPRRIGPVKLALAFVQVESPNETRAGALSDAAQLLMERIGARSPAGVRGAQTKSRYVS